MSTKIRDVKISPSDIGNIEKQLLTLRKVPKSLFNFNFMLSDYLTQCSFQADGNKPIIAHVSKQLDNLLVTYKDPVSDPYLFIIGSRFDAVRAQCVALSVFRRALKVHMEAPEDTPHVPYWHYVTGSSYDPLRDNKDYRSNLNAISFLVIDNISYNSPPNLVQKVRDLLRMYEEIPILLIISGGNPLEFSYTQLFRRPNRLVYLDRKERQI